MNTIHRRRARLAAGCCAALAALTLAAADATAATAGTRVAAPGSRPGGPPIVTTNYGAVRGTAAGSVDEFLGIPYAAPPVATHESELPYLFDLPNAPFPPQFSAGQQSLAASMRAAWTNFATRGNPTTEAVPWPAVGAGTARMLSLVPPQPKIETDFAARHHCAFWAAG